MASGNNISEKIADIIASKSKINARLVNLGVALTTDDLATMATKIEENITNQGAVQATVTEGKTYTIPKGYHNGSGTVTGLSDTTGDAEKYKLQSKEVTPTKSQINVTNDEGYYGLSSVTVNAIPDKYQDVTSVTALAGDVLTGKVIVDSEGTPVAGTMANNGAVVQTLSTTTTSYNVPKGYHNGNGVISISLEEKNATPTKNAQSITPSAGKVLSKVSVAAIPAQFVDVTDTTASAENILAGETAAITYVEGTTTKYEVVEGTMTNNTGWTLELNPETDFVNIPKGYHDGTGSVTVAYKELDVTPSEQEQEFATSTEFISRVTVAAINKTQYLTSWTKDATAKADKILSTETAYVNGLKVTGSMPNIGAVNESLSGSKTSYTVPKGYHSGTGKVTINLQEKTATPTKSVQNIVPTDGSVLSKVTVNAIPDAYQDVTEVTATADTVLEDYDFVNSLGEKVAGAMTNNGSVKATFTGLDVANSSYTIPKGYHDGTGVVSLTSDIEELLASI